MPDTEIIDRPKPELTPGAALRRAIHSAAPDAFVEQVLRDWTDGEAEGLSTTLVAQAVKTFWDLASDTAGDDPRIWLFPIEASAESVKPMLALGVVQVDAPFLVDTIMGEVNDGGYGVRAMFHPIVKVNRSAKGVRGAGPEKLESMVLVLLDAVGRERGEALKAGVAAALADQRAAVGDFRAMRDLMSRVINDLGARCDARP